MCRAYGLGIIPWSPLAMGMLAGRYTDGKGYPRESRAKLRGGIYSQRVTPDAVRAGNKFVLLADKFGCSAAQLAVLWVKDQPGITAPIIGPKTREQLELMIPVLEMSLSDEIRNQCDILVPPGSAVADFHNSAHWMRMTLS